MEQMFSVIDSRYRSKKPLIVTTNLKLEESKNPTDLAHARTYDHILERCVLVLFSGKNFWEERARATKAATKEIVRKDNKVSLVKKIDQITYIVRIHFSKTSKENHERQNRAYPEKRDTADVKSDNAIRPGFRNARRYASAPGL